MYKYNFGIVDYFDAHTYEHVDLEGIFHFQWN